MTQRVETALEQVRALGTAVIKPLFWRTGDRGRACHLVGRARARPGEPGSVARHLCPGMCHAMAVTYVSSWLVAKSLAR